MTRLPAVSGDNNAWGSILNAFLAVGHNSDGSLIFIVPQGDAIYIVDGSSVTNKVFFIDAFTNLVFQAPASDSIAFNDHLGNALFYATTAANGGLQLGPTIFINGTNNANTAFSPILGVDALGNAVLKAFVDNNAISLQDSSGNVIASFAGANKIVTMNGGQIDARTAVSNNYTVLASDYIVAYTSTSSAFAATLPAAAAGNAGQTWIVKDESGAAATHNITVKTAGGTIDGVAAGTGKVINTNFGVLRVYSNGTNYFTF